MSHAIVWSADAGPELAGKLELGSGSVVLSGRTRDGRETGRRLALNEIADVRVERITRRGGESVCGLVIVGGDGVRIELVPLDGAGVLHEIADGVAPRAEKPKPGSG